MVTFEISMSLDGYVAGPDAGWREIHSQEGGDRNTDAELSPSTRRSSS